MSVGAAEAAAPRELYGRSVIVTWSETRVHRPVGGSNFDTVHGDENLSIYVSTEGHVFNRLTGVVNGRSGGSDQLAGEVNARRVVSFSGTSMTITQPFTAGGARRITVEFGSGFSRCIAKAVYGKEVGSATSVNMSAIAHKLIETQSASAGPATCSVLDGNVFASQ